MKLLKLKAVTNGTRHILKLQKNLLCKSNRVIKNSLFKNKFNAGRSGQITIRRQGGGCKRLQRQLLFANKSYFGIIIGVVYDPSRSGFLSLSFDLIKKKLFFLPHINTLSPGNLVSTLNKKQDLRLGYRSSLDVIPVGAIINNLSFSVEKSSLYIKAAGTYGQIIQKNKDKYSVKLPSNKIISVTGASFATLGNLSNELYNKRVLGKAGKNRLKGLRPKVRGVAMNPVDHPHGGRTNGGRPSVTPWGYPTKGKPTVYK